jgi:hypothetical protein
MLPKEILELNMGTALKSAANVAAIYDPVDITALQIIGKRAVV